VLLQLGKLAKAQGDCERAAVQCRASLALQQQQESRIGIACCLAGLAGVYGRQAQPKRAAYLCGATAALLSALNTDLEPHDQAEWEADIAAIRAQIGEEVFAAAWAEGRAMALDQAIAVALEGSPAAVRAAGE
jgi:hypothetical protein